MKAFRIVLEKHGRTSRDAFGGISGLMADGRWHSRPRRLDYAAESLSLASLERLVHYKRFTALTRHVRYVIEVPDSAIQPIEKPPAGWDGDAPLPAAQKIGNDWYDRAHSPALLVPSAVTPGERNLILNSSHPKWDWNWVIAGPAPFEFDPRLIELLRSRRKP